MVGVSRYLRWYDYVVFAVVLAISATIGIVFAVRARRNSSPEEYLLASKQLTVVPVTLSLLASFMSAITLLGTPAEIYVYGTQYVLIGICYFFVILFSNEVTIPVFHRLRLQTSYQYLKYRFHKVCQIAGAISFTVQMTLYMGIVIYAPSLALSAVTGFNLWIAVVSIGIVATFYTTIGGIKAVVWTDVFQIVMMFAGLLIAMVKGFADFGGVANVWRTLEEGGRVEFWKRDFANTLVSLLHTACTLHIAHLQTAPCTLHTSHCTLHTAHCTLHTGHCTLQTAHCALPTSHCTLHTAHCTLHTCKLHTAHRKLHTAHTNFSFSPNPTVRHTFWTQAFGNIFVWSSVYGINQAMVQRCLSLNTMREIRIAYWANVPGLVLLMLICSACGAVIYSAYRHCDPISSGDISAADQLLPLYVMDYLSSIPVLLGIFVAAVFSGSLSTVSSGVNSLASVTLHDVLDVCTVNYTEKRKTILCKIIAMVYGLMSLGFAVLASQLGPVLQAALGIFGMVGGPLLGVFTLGMVFKVANWKGAIVGHIVSQCFVFWIGFGYYIHGVSSPRLPVSTSNCTIAGVNTTATAPGTSNWSNLTTPSADGIVDPQDLIFPVYKVSYTWYAMYGWATTMAVGLIVSLLTRDKEQEAKLSRNLFTPLVRRYMQPRPDDEFEKDEIPSVDPKDVKVEYEFPMQSQPPRYTESIRL